MEEVENEKAVKRVFFPSFQTPRLRGLRVGEASTPGGNAKFELDFKSRRQQREVFVLFSPP
jgi:hypothetical protein